MDAIKAEVEKVIKLVKSRKIEVEAEYEALSPEKEVESEELEDKLSQLDDISWQLKEWLKEVK